jgi:type II secretory pathway component PulL
MSSQYLFEIHYRFEDQDRSFFQSDSAMTDVDAWYYACLHAGVAMLHTLSVQRVELDALIEHAKRAGVTAVKWMIVE